MAANVSTEGRQDKKKMRHDGRSRTPRDVATS